MNTKLDKSDSETVSTNRPTNDRGIIITKGKVDVKLKVKTLGRYSSECC